MPHKESSDEYDLYIKVPNENCREFSTVQSLLEIYNYGKTQVYICFNDTKKLVHALDTHIHVTETLLSRLKNVVGEDSVKQKKKRNL